MYRKHKPFFLEQSRWLALLWLQPQQPQQAEIKKQGIDAWELMT